MAIRRIGNRRLFKLPNHRLTKTSYLQTVEQLEQALAAQNILLFGRGPYNAAMGGTVSYWSYDVSAAPVIAFLGAGEVAYNDASGLARVVVYDPTNPTQSTTLDLSGLVGDPGWIWWRRAEGDAGLRSEVKWVVPTGEETEPTETIRYEYLEFAWTSDTPSTTYNLAEGWRILGRVVDWSGSVPTIQFIPFLEASNVLTRGLAVRAVSADPPAIPLVTGDLPTNVNDGLVHLLRRAIDALWMLQDADANIPTNNASAVAGSVGTWYRRPKYGTKQLDDWIDYLRVNTGQGVLALITVTYDSGTGTWSLKDAAKDYIATGFLAPTLGFPEGGRTVSTVDGNAGQKVCGVYFTAKAGFTINGYQWVQALHVNPPLPYPASGIDLPRVDARQGAVQHACSVPLPINPTDTNIGFFGVGSRFTATSGPPYDVVPGDPITIYADYSDMTLVVYGHKG